MNNRGVEHRPFGSGRMDDLAQKVLAVVEDRSFRSSVGCFSGRCGRRTDLDSCLGGLSGLDRCPLDAGPGMTWVRINVL